MDLDEDSSVALLAIHPRYARAIFDGRKTVEFRKTLFRRSVDYVVVYVCHPVQRVLGFFRVGSVETGAPSALWQKYAAEGAIGADAFWAYYSGTDEAVAIVIERVVSLPRPVSLRTIHRTLSAPQSFTYLTRPALKRLKVATNAA